MLTPTGATVTEYWNAIKAGNPTHVKMEFTAQSVTLTDADIDITHGVVINDILNGYTDICFGRAVMKELNTRVVMNDNVRYLNWADEFTLSFGVEINGTTNWVQVGKFIGERPTNVTTVDVIDFVAYDRMCLFDILIDDYFTSISYPITLQQLYEGICTYAGLAVEAGNPLANAYARSFARGELNLTGYTCRDVIAWIAEACGCYARITASGKCKLVWFSDQTSYQITPTEEFHVEHADLYSGMIWNEFDLLKWNEADMLTWNEVCGYYALNYAVKAVKLKQTSVDIDLDYPQAEDNNVYIIQDNPFLAINNPVSDTTTYVKPIYDRLEAFGGQLPLTAECVGNWLVESGDIVSIYVADEIIHSAIYVRTLVWKGNIIDTYETTGSRNRQIVSYSSKERLATSKQIKLYAQDNFYQIQSGIDIKPEGIEISGSKYIKMLSGDVIINYGGTFSVQSGAFVVDANGDATFSGELNAASGTFAGKISASGMELGPYTLKDADSKAGVYLHETEAGLLGTFNNVLLMTGYTTTDDYNYHNTFKIGYHPGILAGTEIPYLGNEDTNFDIADRTHPVYRAYMENIVPGSGSKVRIWLAGYDSDNGMNTRAIDFYRSNDENYIVSPVNPDGGDATGHVGTANDPMKDGYFEDLYVGGSSVITASDISGLLSNFYNGGSSISKRGLHNCTATDTKNAVKGRVVNNRYLILSGRYRIIGITRTGAMPGVIFDLPSGCYIRATDSYYVGTNEYSDAGRFGEASYVSFTGNDTTFTVQVTETYANVINGKDLIIHIPTIIIPIKLSTP